MAASKLSVSVGQHSTAGRKDRNDDSYGVMVPKGAELDAKGIVMAIADGMSSSTRAKIASETCIRNFLEDYYSTHESWTVKRSAALVLKSVNSWLNAQNHALDADGADLLSTFSGAVLKAGTLHIFHVGDTRIALLRDGALEPLTAEHRVEAGRTRHFLSRAMGASPHVEIDYRSETVQTGDHLIFTTDGVHETVTAPEIVKLVSEHPGDLDSAAKAVVALAHDHGSDDNLTCQIVRVDNPGRHDNDSHFAALKALPFPPELASGMTFEGYKIVREIHSSKRTQVYLAEDVKDGGLFVIKTPSVNYEDDQTYLEMFTREDWIGRLVASPHVLKVIQPEKARRFLYYVTEYFDGQTLRQWMLDNPKPSLETARTIVEQIAKGLRAFHRKDIIHQDLKPENIMIDRNGLVKIIDFGSSRAASQNEDGSTSAQPQLVGTIDYTAPEYHQGNPGTNRSDIFSLGVIAYEMLTGKLPYGKGFASARDAARKSYIPAHSIREDIPAWIDATLAKAVEKSPHDRTDALSALVEDLKRPNAAQNFNRPVPLIERKPLAVWRTLAFLLFAANVVLLYLLSRAH